MDDLRMLRDLGRELEDDPPASLARQRARLADAAAGAGRAARSPGRPPRPGRWTLLGVVAAATAALILVPAVLLRGGEDRSRPGRPASGADGPDTTMNVLLIGSDARGNGEAARSDSIVLAHLPKGRGSALAASLPRDSQVRIPACRTRTGGHAPAHRGRLGEAFAIGGTACTVKTVESATGVQVDLALTVDFGGFRSMVDALGGVPFTVPQAIDDPSSGFRISAGTHRLNGAQALGYVRVRHGVGDGSDLMRVERQQRFLAALAKRAKDVQTGNPVRFLAFLKAASGSVEMAPRLDLKGLQEVARSLGRTKPGTVRYTTVKVRPDPSDLARLVWDQAAAARLFAHFKTRD
ncbi:MULTISPECIES: LCP family protein [Actinomadura]|uniref:LCP family protein n=1 Tax=Actinomadura yumaensis TaxID=111807 RepID=A0ABW2CVK2_9ACTN|nr:LCP family protein [Actinomadura sp. J1-007]MWK36301.1 LytR family transcriptional regulator [Actinomadura sp. J1-007]